MSTEIDDSAMPLVEHLTELRTRLIRAVIVIAVFFVGCFIVAEEIFEILVIPLQWGQPVRRGGGAQLHRAARSSSSCKLKIALFGAIFLAFPVIATELYKFVAPGLYKNERGGFPSVPHRHADPVRAGRLPRLLPHHAAGDGLLPVASSSSAR